MIFGLSRLWEAVFFYLSVDNFIQRIIVWTFASDGLGTLVFLFFVYMIGNICYICDGG